MVATITTSTITATWNNTSLTSGIQGAMTTLFGTAIDSFTSSNIVNKVYQIQYTSSFTLGSAFFVVGISSTNNYIYWQLFDSWNSSTHSGTNGSQQNLIATLPSTTSNITLSIVNGSEFKGVFIQQSSWSLTNTCIGLFRPSIIAPSWNQNNNLFAFMTPSVAPFTMTQWLFSSNNPFGTPGTAGSVFCGFQIYAANGTCTFQNTNTLNSSQSDVQSNLVLLYPTQAGYLCGSCGISTELGIVGGSFNIGDTITCGSKIFTVVYNAAKPNFTIETT